METGVYSKDKKIEVRLVKPAEEEKWEQLMKEHHYLGYPNKNKIQTFLRKS